MKTQLLKTIMAPLVVPGSARNWIAVDAVQKPTNQRNNKT